MHHRPITTSLVLAALAALAACDRKAPDASEAKKVAAASAPPAASAASEPAASAPAAAPTPAPETASQPNPERNAYFGETHLHTSWSVDAWVMGNRLTGPADAYKYAKGETIKHPMGFDIRIDTPLDFMGVTDHSEYVGVTREANTPGSYVSKLPEAQPMIMKDPNSSEEQNKVFSYLLSLTNGPPVKAFMSPKVTATVWKENVKLADEANQPGRFTAFCSYEWTSMPGQRNLHRNVFFRACEDVPDYPFSSLESNKPTELWSWMDAQRKAGNELLAISHNANVSDGWMYPTEVDNTTGRPIDAAWAEARMRNERLVEIKQGKGQSETHPLLSPNDEFASYELYQAILGLPADIGRIDRINGSYGRQALKDGIAMQDVRGFNPYKFGMAGGSDSHNSASPYRHDNFFGLHADADGSVERRFAGVLIGGTMDVRLENPGGLTGVWAEENTRAAIWDAMYRKETFGVSGPHIKLRFFGGWDYKKDIVDARDWVKQSYAGGVPMGADLPPMPSGAKGTAPSFVVWAVKDPTSGSLDRIQVIKGWTQHGQSFEKVYDVVWAGERKPDKWSGHVPAIQNTVDLSTASYSNSHGAAELKTVWTDPDFDASQHAFYYARVLEVPTPRWTLIQALKSGLPPPDIVPLTGQERAWSSPIWYAPSAEARQADAPGLTVEALKARGATALNDAQLKALLVGKAHWMQNKVTGEQFSQNFTAEGDTVVFRVGFNATHPSDLGKRAQDGYEAFTHRYRIQGGKLVTWVAQEPYSMTFYKLGNTTYAARGNEFGYANYEIIAPPQIALNPLISLANQFSLELKLTETQRQQILPFLKEEVTALGALKKDTKLSALQKLEKLRETGVAIDEKIRPLLNAEQQQKFETLRENLRRRMAKEMAEQAAGKVEAAVKSWFTEKSVR
ncbi:MAG: DUF3604 domain-containing protein [Burkholderiales bacterium]|nr:DUF3604 domain-containing protein [Burkholderiales bacterium]